MEIGVYVDGKFVFNIPIKKSDTLQKIKKNVKDFTNQKFYVNDKEVLEVFNTTQYDKLKMEKIWSILLNPKIYVESKASEIDKVRDELKKVKALEDEIENEKFVFPIFLLIIRYEDNQEDNPNVYTFSSLEKAKEFLPIYLKDSINDVLETEKERKDVLTQIKKLKRNSFMNTLGYEITIEQTYLDEAFVRF